MKLPLFVAALLLFPIFAFGQTVGTITAVDTTSETFGITADKSKELRVFRFRKTGEVIINGQRAKFAELAPGMKARVTTAEAGVAGRIEATGMPAKISVPATTTSVPAPPAAVPPTAAAPATVPPATAPSAPLVPGLGTPPPPAARTPATPAPGSLLAPAVLNLPPETAANEKKLIDTRWHLDGTQSSLYFKKDGVVTNSWSKDKGVWRMIGPLAVEFTYQGTTGIRHGILNAELTQMKWVQPNGEKASASSSGR